MPIPLNLAHNLTPRVVLGWRARGSELRGCTVDVHQNAYQTLRDVGDECLEFMAEATLRPYEPFATLEDDQVFELGSRDGSTPADLDSASIAQLVWKSDELQTLDPAKMRDRYLFYAVVWSSTDGPAIGFVRKKNARAAINSGSSYWGLNNGTLKKILEPDFVIEAYFDIVVHGDSLFMLHENSARVLLNDIAIASTGVPSNVQAFATVLGGVGALTPSAMTAIEAVASRKINVARQLARMPEFFSGVTIDATKLRSTALERCSDPDSLINANNQVCVEESRVEELLDLVAGRLYFDTVTDEERRAERVSRRNK